MSTTKNRDAASSGGEPAGRPGIPGPAGRMLPPVSPADGRRVDNRQVRWRKFARQFRYPMRWAAFFAGGVPAILVFPGPSLSYVAWFALVPGMVLFIRAATAKEAVARAWWFGAGYLIAILWWMTPEIGPGVVLIGAVFGV